MQLTVSERLALLGLLPAKGTLLTMRVADDLRREIGFSEQELDDINLRQEEGHIKWDQDPLKEIEFGERSRRIVYDKLAELEEQEELRAEHLSLCDKFGFTGEEK